MSTPPALWFVFLLAYGAFPVTLATDLHKIFCGTIANATFFWLTAAVTTAICVLPVFGIRQLMRYLRPAYYQVVQEIAARERAGEAAVAVELAGGARSGKSAAHLAARASRLMQRKALRSGVPSGSASGGGALTAVLRRRYSGFVPPYEARSRVFDSNELRESAAAAGYNISSTGEISVPPAPSRFGTLTGAISAAGGAAGGGGGGGLLLQATGIGGFGLNTGEAGGFGCAPLSPGSRPSAGPFGTGVLARAFSGLGAMSQGRRTLGPGMLLVGSGALPLAAAGVGGLPLSPGADAEAGEQPLSLPPFGLVRSSVGASTIVGFGGAGVSFFGTGVLSTTGETLPAPRVTQEDTYASNPVLALLDREFSRDPRRHRRGIKLSLMSINNLPRIRSRTPKGRGSRSGSPMRPSSFTGALSAGYEPAWEPDGGGGTNGGGTSGDKAESEPWRMAFSEGGELRAFRRGTGKTEEELAALESTADSGRPSRRAGSEAQGVDAGGNGVEAPGSTHGEQQQGAARHHCWPDLAASQNGGADGRAWQNQLELRLQELELQQPQQQQQRRRRRQQQQQQQQQPQALEQEQHGQRLAKNAPLTGDRPPRLPGQQPPAAQQWAGAARPQALAWAAAAPIQQQLRPGASPSRLRGMAAPADPPPARVVAAPAELCPSPLPGAATTRSVAGTQVDGSGASLERAAGELHTEDPAMLQLYLAALKGRAHTAG
jgi:hypothetical protein